MRKRYPVSRPSRYQELAVGTTWAALGVVAATVCFWLIRHHVDKGQASLLYLPVVLACAIRFGFGPSILCALLSFLCWDFFLPPFGTFAVADPKDWLSLAVFLGAAVTTAQLASRAQAQTHQARAREAEDLGRDRSGEVTMRCARHLGLAGLILASICLYVLALAAVQSARRDPATAIRNRRIMVRAAVRGIGREVRRLTRDRGVRVVG